ncbi:hypothetical protein [Ralstonia sp. UBA689]|uniref:hypothetical protein n=1 Tax=Ralstonia sp. UBA689 TaxID=1947373 RepID=UPI0025D0D2A8|nr:hypothetical protein [Ralstonia sp. UBA689]
MQPSVLAFVVRVTSSTGVRQRFFVLARSSVDALLMVLGQRGISARGASARPARRAA